jgi:DNA-binding NarL/FixJ family response regulator
MVGHRPVREQPWWRANGGGLRAVAPLRVVIAEDSLLVRVGVEALLATEDGVEVAGVCSDYEDLITRVDRDTPDVVVTDIRMPPTSTDEGIRAAAALRRSHPEVGVVVLSQFLDPTYLMGLIAEGSSRRGYLLKERVAAAGELVSAIQTVAAGGSFIDPLVVDSLVSAEARTVGTPLERLTPRERETLAAVATGKSNLAIAARFSVTERAVEKHINSIFLKLDLLGDRDTNRRVKAVLMFLSQGRLPQQ